jgi:hypothetical protein
MVRFYSNENFPQDTVEALRQLGHDVLTSHDAGKSRQSIPDKEVLEFATAEKRVLLTLNRQHFIRLHDATNGQHCGIVVCTQDTDFQGQAQRIHAQVSGCGDLGGSLLRVNRPNPAAPTR